MTRMEIRTGDHVTLSGERGTAYRVNMVRPDGDVDLFGGRKHGPLQYRTVRPGRIQRLSRAQYRRSWMAPLDEAERKAAAKAGR